MLAQTFLFTLFSAASLVDAAPALVELSARQAITALTSAQISVFKPFTHFASTAYCQPSTTLAWNCGGMYSSFMGKHCSKLVRILANCQANSDFIPVASGGDGSSVQFCETYIVAIATKLTWPFQGYVGFSPSQATVIVAHQGTDTSKMSAV
jgi:hypothetical protein